MIVINAMLVGRYKLVPPLPAAERKKDPRALGLALAFAQAPELQYLDEKRMGKVYVARPEDEGRSPSTASSASSCCRRRSRARRSGRSSPNGAIRCARS